MRIQNSSQQMQFLQVPARIWWPTSAWPSHQQLPSHQWWWCYQTECRRTPTTAQNPRHSYKPYTIILSNWVVVVVVTSPSGTAYMGDKCPEESRCHRTQTTAQSPRHSYKPHDMKFWPIVEQQCLLWNKTSYSCAICFKCGSHATYVMHNRINLVKTSSACGKILSLHDEPLYNAAK